jgi:HK97 family phage major capsid protein
MKTSRFILSALFFAVLGIMLMSFVGHPATGLAFSALAYIPLPQNVFGDNIIPGASEKETLVTEIVNKLNANIEEKTKSFLKPEEIEKIRKDFEISIKAMNETELKAYTEKIESLKVEMQDYKKANEDIKIIVKRQAEEIDALKSPTMPESRTKLSKHQQLEMLLANAFCSDEFKNFEDRAFSGATAKMTLGGKDKIELHRVGEQSDKTNIPITDHTGTVMISEISTMVRDDSPIRTSHLRDILNVRPTKSAQIVGGEVYDFSDALTMGAIIVAGNDEALESSFKSREQTWSLKRIVHSIRLSKRWFKVNGLQWVIDHVLAKLPNGVFTVEDFEFLFGDGTGNHVTGLTKSAQAFNLAYKTYTTADIASIATYNSGAQTLVTFAAAHRIKNGDTLIVANSTNYNHTFLSVEVLDATRIVIDHIYQAETATGWTGSATSTFYRAVDNAQEADVLKVAAALLKAGEFMPTAHIINTQTQTKLGLLKDTHADYLNIVKDKNDEVVSIGGLPVLALTAMPAGKFLTGDFSQRAVEVRELTPFNIQFKDDVDSAKKNEIVLIVEEEIIFPVYNPYWFVYGKFSDGISQLETPAS